MHFLHVVRTQISRAYEAFRNIVSDRIFLRRYVLVGVGNVSINFGIFYILYHFLGVWYIAASFIGFSARFLFKFTALRFWVFGHTTTKSIVTHFVHFSLLEAGMYVASLPLLVFLVEWVRLPPPLGVVITIAVLYVISMGISRIIFKIRDQTIPVSI